MSSTRFFADGDALEDVNNNSFNDEDFKPSQNKFQNRQELRNLSMISDRYEVSSRAGAAIANAALAGHKCY